ncbi:MAG: ketopantoate reductase family protein, partial [Myxococcaceae bacterium]
MAFRFLVMGCGGIGGITTALLHEAGHDVHVFSTNAAIADAIDARGFQLRDEGSTRAIRGKVDRRVPGGPFDVVLLATQPPQVEEAARAALPALGPNGLMVCLQNGLCEERVAKTVGEARTVGAVVAWGASMSEPGVYERTASGGFTLGRLDGAHDDRLLSVAAALESIGPVDLTDNLRGKRWSKLAINCAVTSLGTLGGDRLGALLPHRFVRRLALELMSE